MNISKGNVGNRIKVRGSGRMGIERNGKEGRERKKRNDRGQEITIKYIFQVLYILNLCFP